MRHITPTVKHLLIINCIVFAGTYLLGNKDLFYGLLALYYPLSDYFMPWQVFSHMFMHGGYQHLLFNMFALFMFGIAVERVFGQRKFLTLYISSGLGAVALTFIVYYVKIYPSLIELQSLGFSFDFIKEVLKLDILSDRMFQGDILISKLEPILDSFGYTMNQLDVDSFRMLFDLIVTSNGSMVGASGAIMGILVAFGMLNPNAELMMIFLPIPIKAKYFVMLYGGMELILGTMNRPTDNVAHFAHLGGMIFGYILLKYWKKDRNAFY